MEMDEQVFAIRGSLGGKGGFFCKKTFALTLDLTDDRLTYHIRHNNGGEQMRRENWKIPGVLPTLLAGLVVIANQFQHLLYVV